MRSSTRTFTAAITLAVTITLATPAAMAAPATTNSGRGESFFALFFDYFDEFLMELVGATPTIPIPDDDSDTATPTIPIPDDGDSATPTIPIPGSGE